MTIDPRTPVLVGAGQFTHRPASVADALEPLAMMVEAVERAATDAACPRLLADAGLVVAVRGAWSYSDPARLVAERIGAPHANTALTPNGGNTPQSLINTIARRIQSGALDVAVVVGAEAIHSRRRSRAEDVAIPTTSQKGIDPDEIIGHEVPMSSDEETARGIQMPVQFYPMFESAIRHSRRETVEDHRDRIARLWARFNEVAMANPYAWVRTPMTALQIREPAEGNRMVGFPYTKAMNSNWYLDQAAALILCSAGKAQALGVPRDRWVFPWAGTDAHDTLFVSHRDNLHASPAIRVAGRRAMELAGIGDDDIAHVDLYSCFPSAVQIAAAELGLSEDRTLTVTGGLTFAGGPLNNYVTHSIASMSGVLRDDARSIGLVTANGGFLTKHAIGVYSTEPHPDGFRHDDVQAQLDVLPRREAMAEWAGPVTVEAYTVMHGRGGPETALFGCLTPDGHRVWGSSTDDELMHLGCREELVGRAAEMSGAGDVHLV